MKLIIISILLTSILLVGCSKERILSKGGEEQVLAMLDQGNISSFKMEAVALQILNAPDEVINNYVSRMKMRYPKFSEDLFYSAIALDEDNQYSISMRTDDRNCIIYTNKINTINDVKTCYEKFNLCMVGKDIKDLDSGDVKTCMKAKECGSLNKLDKGKIIPKKYCEVIYGRKL